MPGVPHRGNSFLSCSKVPEEGTAVNKQQRERRQINTKAAGAFEADKPFSAEALVEIKI